MAAELKTEIFSYNIFHAMWYNFGNIKTMPTVIEIYGDECLENIAFEEVCDDLFVHTIFIRLLIFRKIYSAEFSYEKLKSLTSLLDCYEYVNRTCDRDELFGHLTIFERMFATLTFVAFSCLQIYRAACGINIVNYSYMLWTMCFDKFITVFYEKGGWDQLKITAEPSKYLSKFFMQFDDGYLNFRKVREAIDNFCHFTDAIRNHKRKYKQLIHISKSWIKFRIDHFDSYVNVPLSYEISIDALQGEFLLEDLALVLHPSGCTSMDVETLIQRRKGYDLSSGMSYSELHPASEEMQTHTDIGIQPLNFRHENQIIDNVPNEFSNIDSDFENRAGKKCPVSEREVFTLDITNKNENLECDKNNLTETELPKQILSVDSPKNLHIEQNFLPVVNRIKQSDTSIKNLSNDADSDHSCRSNSFVYKDEDGKMEHICEGNIAEHNNNTITAEVISINKMLERIYSENVGILKDFSLGSENVNSYDVTEMTRKAREDLRNEQRDPEIKNFLKMLLVLDDKEGTKFVLSMLQNDERDPEILEESSNKQKKRHKKKNRK